MADLSISCYIIYIVSGLIIMALSISIVVFSFRTKSYANKIKDLKIKTNFTLDYQNNGKLNIFENSILNEEPNQFEEFFIKYNLKEGLTFNENKKIKNSLNNFYRISVTIIVFLIIISISPICFICGRALHYLCCVFSVAYGTDIPYEKYIRRLIIEFVVESLIVLILLSIFAGFYISYKNKFQNDFFDFYYTINDYNLQNSFKNYYDSLFDLNNVLILNIIFLPILLFIFIANILFYCFYSDPCELFDEDD